MPAPNLVVKCRAGLRIAVGHHQKLEQAAACPVIRHLESIRGRSECSADESHGYFTNGAIKPDTLLGGSF